MNRRVPGALLVVALSIGVGRAVPMAMAKKSSPPRWTGVTMRSSCEAMSPDYCQGLYGFTVHPDGSYRAGPNPTGRSHDGQLTPAEQSRVAGAASAASASASRGKLHCDAGGGIAGTNLTIVITSSAGKDLMVFEANKMGTGTNCTVGNRATVLALSRELSELMRKYYPRPFEQTPPRLTPHPDPHPTPSPPSPKR